MEDLEEYVFCPQCDSKCGVDDQKCSKCGQPLFDEEGNSLV